MNPVNEHGDMIAITTHRKMQADLYDQIYDLQFENAGLRVELEQQAIVNGKGSEREAALLAKVETLERENAALRAVFEAAKAMTHYETEGAAVGWPDWDSKFDALKDAIDAARKEKQ